MEQVSQESAAWFNLHSKHGTIEGGVKEGKAALQLHHLRVCSATGLAMQELPKAFAANSMLWAPRSLSQNCRMAARSPASRPTASTRGPLAWTPRLGHLEASRLFAKVHAARPVAGIELAVGCIAAIQLRLPLFRSTALEPTWRIPSLVATSLR